MNINIYAENKQNPFLKLIPNSIPFIINDQKQESTQFILNADSLRLCTEKVNFSIDFNHPNYSKRAKQANYKNEMLLRAVGKDKSKHIIDLTGGLAKESYLMCDKGYSVTLIEKSPIIFLLILHAKYQSCNSNLDNLTLIHADSCNYLTKANKQDICYADPMFNKGILRGTVKKDIDFLRQFSAKDDPIALLELAKKHSDKFILKLPKKEHIPQELGQENYHISGKNISYHIFKE